MKVVRTVPTRYIYIGKAKPRKFPMDEGSGSVDIIAFLTGLGLGLVLGAILVLTAERWW